MRVHALKETRFHYTEEQRIEKKRHVTRKYLQKGSIGDRVHTTTLWFCHLIKYPKSRTNVTAMNTSLHDSVHDYRVQLPITPLSIFNLTKNLKMKIKNITKFEFKMFTCFLFLNMFSQNPNRENKKRRSSSVNIQEEGRNAWRSCLRRVSWTIREVRRLRFFSEGQGVAVLTKRCRVGAAAAEEEEIWKEQRGLEGRVREHDRICKWSILDDGVEKNIIH